MFPLTLTWSPVAGLASISGLRSSRLNMRDAATSAYRTDFKQFTQYIIVPNPYVLISGSAPGDIFRVFHHNIFRKNKIMIFIYICQEMSWEYLHFHSLILSEGKIFSEDMRRTHQQIGTELPECPGRSNLKYILIGDWDGLRLRQYFSF